MLFYCTANLMVLKINKTVLGKEGKPCPSPETHVYSHPALPFVGRLLPSLRKTTRATHSKRPGLCAPQTLAATRGHSGCGCPLPAAELPWSHAGRSRAHPPKALCCDDPRDHTANAKIPSGSASGSTGSYPASASASLGQGEVNPQSHSHGASAGYNQPI